MPAEQATGRPLAANTGWTWPASPSATTRSYLASSTLGASRCHCRWCSGRPWRWRQRRGCVGRRSETGDAIISIGTSGVAAAVADVPIADLSGEVITSADATGRFLWLAWTPIAARVLDAMAHILGVGHEEFSRLALSAPPGSEGLVVLPYFERASTPGA